MKRRRNSKRTWSLFQASLILFTDVPNHELIQNLQVVSSSEQYQYRSLQFSCCIKHVGLTTYWVNQTSRYGKDQNGILSLVRITQFLCAVQFVLLKMLFFEIKKNKILLSNEISNSFLSFFFKRFINFNVLFF